MKTTNITTIPAAIKTNIHNSIIAHLNSEYKKAEAHYDFCKNELLRKPNARVINPATRNVEKLIDGMLEADDRKYAIARKMKIVNMLF
ncbi:MAG: hypothetical protein UIM53_02795 [Acutalibacteraceae bacterium]|nr:hypothetical protein [Acutalibacteraceae bacterium]